MVTGDPLFDALEDKTQEFLNGYVTPETIREVLDSSDATLQQWACRGSRRR